MARTRTYLLCILAILLAADARVHTQSPPAVFSGYETRITSDPGDQYDPAIAGDVVVFTDYRSSNTDVYYVDLSAMLEKPVVVAPGNQELTCTSAGRIVFTDYRSADVALFETTTSTTRNLTAADKNALGRGFNSVDPAIDGDLVAWEDDRDGNMELYAMNVATNEERRITNTPEVDEKPSVSGSRIVWQRCPMAGGNCDIWLYDWGTGAATAITETPAGDERQAHIRGDHIVYQGLRGGDLDLYLYDLSTNLERRLPLSGDQANPHVSGDNVAFDDLSGGVYHVKLWHLPTDDVFAVTTGTAGQYLNGIDGNRVVYTDDRNGDLDVYMFTFTIESAGDTTPPAIAITPSCPAALALGASFTVDVLVTDEGSGVKTQTVSNGALALDTSTVGAHLLTIDASDNAGNLGSNGCSYAVVYDFAGAGGFASPIADQPAVNSAKAGSAVPVKFQLPDGHGGFVSDLAAVASITFGQVADFASAPDSEVEATAGASGLRYDAAAQQFVFTWKTDKTMAGRSYVLVLSLNDGTEYDANFKLK